MVQAGQTIFDGGAFAGRAPGYFLSLDFETSNKVRRRLAIKKMSSRGRAGFHTLGSEAERHARPGAGRLQLIAVASAGDGGRGAFLRDFGAST